MADNRNYAALDWLVHEISETLKEARQSLESYVENPSDTARIRFCLTHIHQVHGSLQMVEFYGAAMLANEMEQLTQAMIAGRVSNATEAQEVLMRAILQFPVYLEQVKQTRRDNPLIVLPLLNDLRAVRGESLLTDTKLFMPNLTPAKKVSGARLAVTQDNVQFQAMALKLRQMYQYAASGFIRGINTDENLSYLQKVFSRMQKLTHGTARFALWDICLALHEALAVDALEPSVAVKNLLRQLDKEIKLLAVHGVKALTSFTNDELIKNLLYYVARAGKNSSGFLPDSHLQRIYDNYQLEQALLEGKDAGNGEATNMIAAPDAEAMNSVVAALKDELSLVKNALDVCLAGGDHHQSIYDSLPIIKRVADTLAVLGLGNIRKKLLQQGSNLKQIVEAGKNLTNDELLGAASQIISIENTLDGLLESNPGLQEPGSDVEITLTRAKEAVLRESRNGLEHAKDAIVEYIASQWNVEHLQPVPATLREIRGGLEIMPLPRPAKILGACAAYIEEQLLLNETRPQWSTLDTLADAITSVEYYLERLTSGGRKEENDLLLSVAEESVATLGYTVANIESLPENIPQVSSPTISPDEDSDNLSAAYALSQPEVEKLPEIENISADLSLEEIESHQEEDIILQNAEPAVLSSGSANITEKVSRPETSHQEKASAPEITLPAGGGVISRDNNDDIDEEIIEIFVEEAAEVTATIGEFFPLWAADQEDKDSLTEFRRAFHTLKGSGRMVGANEIGELAWSIENMLNRIIDHTIDATSVHINIIEKVRQLLPDMIVAFRDNTANPHAAVAEVYRQQAQSLSQGIIPVELQNETVPTVTSLKSDDVELEEAELDLEEDSEDSVVEDEVEEQDLTIDVSSDDEEIIELEDESEELTFELVDESTDADSDDFVEELELELELDENDDADEIDYPEVSEETYLEESYIAQAYAEASANIEEEIAEEISEEAAEEITIEDSNEEASLPLMEVATEEAAEIPERNILDIDDPDAQLWEIFCAEAESHLQVIAEFIAEMESTAPLYEAPSEQIQRALHTLKGSAHMAEITPVAELAAPLERLLKELRSYHVRIDDDILQLLRDTVDYTQAALIQLNQHEPVSIPRLQQFIARVNELRDLHITPLIRQQELAGSGKRPVDPELLAVFMAEDMNLLLNADNIIAQWQENPNDREQLQPMVAELNRLTQAAAHAYLPPMAELGEKIRTVYDAIIAGHLICTSSICASLNAAHSALLDMVDAIAAGQNLLRIPDGINEVLDEILSNEIVTLTALSDDLYSIEESDIENMEAQEAVGIEISDQYVEDQDEEIYLSDEDDSTDSDEETIELLIPEETTSGSYLSSDLDDELDQASEDILKNIHAANIADFALKSISTAKETPVEVLAESDAEIEEDADFDAEIVEIFVEEAAELLDDLDRALHDWQEDWNNQDAIEEMKRLLHTFKGGARLAGLTRIGDLSHDFETQIIELDTNSQLDQIFFQKLHQYQDQLHTGVNLARKRLSGEVIPAATPQLPAPVEEQVTSFNKPTIVVDNTRSSATFEPVDEDDLPEAESNPNVVAFTPRPKVELPATTGNKNLPDFITMPGYAQAHLAARRSGPQEVVKVSAELLEELVNLAGETSISRGRMEQQVTDLGGAIEEMDATIQRLQEQLRRLDIETEAQILFRQEQMAQHEEFDPLEMDRYSQLQQLSRSLIESASDLMDLKYTLSDKTRDTETLLLQQSRINTDLQEGLMRSRMVPFSRLVPRLRRIVRQAATELSKEVDFDLDNVEGEMDRTVLERMVAPLEHMLRNAVDHGIEMPDERVTSGKSANGRILLSLSREGGEVVLRLKDNGRGINLQRVRAKAIERGLMAADAKLTDEDIIQFILHAGFSTAEKVTQISGRGVGMDVVASEIKQLGGSMVINSVWGQGTEFIIRLPFTVSVNRALMIQIGEDLYAVPLNTIEGIVRVSPFELEHFYQDPNAKFEYAGENYLVRYLGGVLDTDSKPKLDGQSLPLPVILVRSADQTVALQVDRLLGSREIVVKTLGLQFGSVRGVSGATIMGDGSVVVILDLHAMIREQRALNLQLIPLELPSLPAEEDAVEKTVMVVDDSVTVRKVTSRFLEREGFRVVTAKDGAEALQLLQDQIPDLMLLDIEMPRMDGFEVAKNVRSSSRMKDLPIIMITSRTGDKHRERAFGLGVNKYMGKPYQEDLLLANIRELLKQRAP